MLSLEVPPEALPALLKHSLIEKIHTNPVRYLDSASAVSYCGAGDFHEREFTGEGQLVAVLDSPIEIANGAFGDCPEAGAPGCAVVYAEDFGEAGIDSSHGSNVGGIILGMAPNAGLLSMNIFVDDPEEEDPQEIATNAEYTIRALDRVISLKEQMPIVAVNMSLGHPRMETSACDEIPEARAMQETWLEGISVVVSSGNDHRWGSLNSPACVSAAISVGAHFDSDLAPFGSDSCEQYFPIPGEMACFSNLNGMLSLVAPGVHIDAGGQDDFSGTSMAAPHVSGAIALLQNIFERHSFWVEQELELQSQAIFNQGSIYSRMELHLDQYLNYDYGFSFGVWLSATEENRIGRAPEGLELSVENENEGARAPYLNLKINHPNIADLRFSLQSPDGESVEFQLMLNQPNLNTTIGRDMLPGVFASLAQRSAAGTWRLRVSDVQGAGRGHLIFAAIFLTESGCHPNCEGRSCGDDGCGGLCGECSGEALCLNGECRLDEGACPMDSCSDPGEMEYLAQAEYSGDTTLCRDHFESPGCEGWPSRDVVYRLELPEAASIAVKSSGYDTILSLQGAQCGGEELACNDDDGGRAARLRADLEPGIYHLVLGGYVLEAGEYELELKICGDSICGDELYCNGNERCDGALCISVQAPCPSDQLSCTQDCDEERRACEISLLPGFCLIDGSCYEAGESNPENPCQRCIPSERREGWSDNPEGRCVDDEFCDGEERCEAGECVPGAPPCDDDGLECTKTCDERLDACQILLEERCLIDAACFFPEEINPEDLNFYCDPESDPLAWSPRPEGLCDDGNYCNGLEEVIDGLCRAGTPPCEGECIQSCEINTRSCILKPDTCRIQGRCFFAEEKSDDPCMVCKPSRSHSGWSPVESSECQGAGPEDAGLEVLEGEPQESDGSDEGGCQQGPPTPASWLLLTFPLLILGRRLRGRS